MIGELNEQQIRMILTVENFESWLTIHPRVRIFCEYSGYRVKLGEFQQDKLTIAEVNKIIWRIDNEW